MDVIVHALLHHFQVGIGPVAFQLHPGVVELHLITHVGVGQGTAVVIPGVIVVAPADHPQLGRESVAQGKGQFIAQGGQHTGIVLVQGGIGIQPLQQGVFAVGGGVGIGIVEIVEDEALVGHFI